MDFTHSHIHFNHRITDSNGMRGAAKIKHKIHYLEIHAYNSLLKAFIAQSEHLTWLKYNDNLSTAQSVHGNSEPPKEIFENDVQLSPSGRGSVPKENYHNKQPFYSSESPVLNNKSDFISPSGSGPK
ncbi:hypothetical protein QL285_014853 [Trifolium repens]|nr:hypothetical protein QL285_014853 [Trifolium repens]